MSPGDGAGRRSARKSQGLRIIVADDDDRMREFYREVLTHLGHAVVGSAADGEALVAACEVTDADLVVTDVRMPRMNGIEAARIVADRIEMPFLFVSAYYDDELVDAAAMAFSYGYLVKPIKLEDLAASIPMAMRQHWERISTE